MANRYFNTSGRFFTEPNYESWPFKISKILNQTSNPDDSKITNPDEMNPEQRSLRLAFFRPPASTTISQKNNENRKKTTKKKWKTRVVAIDFLKNNLILTDSNQTSKISWNESTNYILTCTTTSVHHI